MPRSSASRESGPLFGGVSAVGAEVLWVAEASSSGWDVSLGAAATCCAVGDGVGAGGVSCKIGVSTAAGPAAGSGSPPSGVAVTSGAEAGAAGAGTPPTGVGVVTVKPEERVGAVWTVLADAAADWVWAGEEAPALAPDGAGVLVYWRVAVGFEL
jgi:hypothetical protein